jgi:hypothetical protein
MAGTVGTADEIRRSWVANATEAPYGNCQARPSLYPGNPAQERVEARLSVILRYRDQTQKLPFISRQPAPTGTPDDQRPTNRLSKHFEEDAEIASTHRRFHRAVI